MKQTWGVPVEEIQRGIKHGVRKINVDTDNRLAITGADPQGLRRVRRRVRPARLSQARDGGDGASSASSGFEEFNTAGQAGKIKKVLPPAEMAKRYAKGELAPKIA